MEEILKEINGVFDGEKMVVSDTCSILVPENYASKSMLLVGTELVYRVTDKRAYFKQANNPEKRTNLGKVVLTDTGLKIEVDNDGCIHRMKCLGSFKTFYKLEPGDEVVVAYPEKLSMKKDNWCVIENRL